MLAVMVLSRVVESESRSRMFLAESDMGSFLVLLKLELESNWSCFSNLLESKLYCLDVQESKSELRSENFKEVK